MPGIFGVFKKNWMESPSQLMEKMILSMSYGRKVRVDRYEEKDGGLFFGRVSLGILNPFDQPITNQEGNCWIVFHGELYGNQGSLTGPEYVLKQYIEKGDLCALALNGVFHFAIFDKRSNQIKLFSDKFGLQPLYYSVLPDGIIFGARVKAVIEYKDISRDPDLHSFADFLHFGQILGQKTLFKNVKLLSPGSVLTFNLEDYKAIIAPYWQLDQQFAEKGCYNAKATPKEVIPYLIEAIRIRSRDKNFLGLSLSGGLDTRGLLAGLGKEAEVFFTYTLGLRGCADQKLAESMARVAKTKHEFIELGQGYLGDFENMAQGMIRLSDGMYHPHESTEMLALDYFKKSPFRILLRGHGGEIAKAALAYPIMVMPQVHTFSSSKETLSYILNTTNLGIRDIDPDKLLTRRFSEVMKEGPEQSLQESCGRVSERLAPPDVCIYYYINEHIRRQVVASLEIFRTQIEVRMPYLDHIYLQNLLKLPVMYRNFGEVHLELIKECMPGLVRIPNSNTGAPLDASNARLWVTDKFNSLMRRLNISGFRHYNEFQRWHREIFKESSRRIIFSEQTRDRQIYNMDHLREVFESHVSGRKNYAHLLGTIVGLELWLRSFAD